MSSRTSNPREQQHTFWHYSWFRNQSFTEEKPFAFNLIKISRHAEAVTIAVKPAKCVPKAISILFQKDLRGLHWEAGSVIAIHILIFIYIHLVFQNAN